MMYRFIIFVWLVTALSILSFGQKPFYVHLSPLQGLANNQVAALYQDSEGYVWIGTKGGLQRYDGYHFTTYLPNTRQPGTIGGQHINFGLAEDHKGRLWVATEFNGVSCYDPTTGTFKVFNSYQDSSIPEGFDRVHNLVFDGKSKIYVSTLAGLFTIDTGGSIQNLSLTADGDTLLPTLYTKGVFLDHNGEVWLQHNKGFSIYNPIQQRWYNPMGNKHSAILKENRIPYGAIADDAMVYTSFFTPTTYTKGGEPVLRRNILKYDVNGQVIDTFLLFNHLENIYAGLVQCIQPHKNKIWIGTSDRGLWYIDNGTGQIHQYLPFATNQPMPSIYCILIDRDENIWLGTDNGIYILPPADRAAMQYVSIPTTEDIILKSNNITTTFSGYDSLIYINSGKTSLWQWLPLHPERPAKKILPITSPESTKFFHLLHVGKHYQLISYWFESVQVRYTGQKYLQPLSMPDSLAAQAIHQAFQHASLHDHLWLVGDHHLLLWHATTNQVVAVTPFPFQIASKGINTLWTTFDNKLLFYTPKGGLYEWYPGETATPIHIDLPAQVMRHNLSALTYRDGTIMIGTPRHGLFTYLLASKTTHHFSNLTGLSSNTIQEIRWRNDSLAWIVTKYGLHSYNANRHQLAQVHPYLTKTPFKIYEIAFFNDQEIWLNTEKGLLSVNYHLSEGNTTTPSLLHLSKLSIHGKDIPTHPAWSATNIPHFKLPWDKDFMYVEFTPLQYGQQFNIEYAYRLSGIGMNKWITIGTDPTITITDLPEGYHKLQVRSKYRFGEWGPPNTLLSIQVTIPFWRQLWFYLVLLLVAGMIFFLFYRQRIRSKLALETFRNQIARDLHDDLGSGLSSISIISGVLERDSTSPIDQHTLIQKIGQQAREMNERIREIVWAMTPQEETTSGLVNKLREYAAAPAEERQITFDINTDSFAKEGKLPLLKRQHLYLTIKEAINNTLKHSGASNLNISFTRKNRLLFITVEDNGCGFNPAAETEGSGIKNIKSRVRQIHGEINIQSAKGKGCRITIQVPLT